MASQKLASEKVIVSAPMSFTGSAQRIWKMTDVENGLLKVVMITFALTLIVCAWACVAAWYAVFGIFVIPYRLVRRSSRKRKRDELRHREVLQATSGQ